MGSSEESAVVEVTSVKCACADCVCVVAVSGAVRREGRLYCSAACAEGHPEGAGCQHAGCDCRG